MPWPVLSITRDDQGKTLRLEWRLPARPRRAARRAGRANAWMGFWFWLFLSAIVVDLGKIALWLLVANWGNRLSDTRGTDLILIAACIFLAATPLCLSVTVRALLRSWRMLFPKDPVQAWWLPDVRLFDQEPPEEPPETKGSGVPNGPRRPSPLRAHARPELVAC